MNGIVTYGRGGWRSIAGKRYQPYGFIVLKSASSELRASEEKLVACTFALIESGDYQRRRGNGKCALRIANIVVCRIESAAASVGDGNGVGTASYPGRWDDAAAGEINCTYNLAVPQASRGKFGAI